MAKHGSEKKKKSSMNGLVMPKIMTKQTGITMKKARKIMHEGMIGGKKLSKKQVGFFGARSAGLMMPKRLGKKIDGRKK